MSHPTYQRRSRAHALLDDGARRPLRLDRDNGIDERGGVDHPERVAQVAAATRHGRVGQEELVELALELGRQVPRRPTEPDLLGDFRHDLLHVGLRVVGQRHLCVAHAAGSVQ